MSTEAMDMAFEKWWYCEGSKPPTPPDDCEQHCKKMCEIAWRNGAYKAIEREREAIISYLVNEGILFKDGVVASGIRGLEHHG